MSIALIKGLLNEPENQPKTSLVKMGIAIKSKLVESISKFLFFVFFMLVPVYVIFLSPTLHYSYTTSSIQTNRTQTSLLHKMLQGKSKRGLICYIQALRFTDRQYFQIQSDHTLNYERTHSADGR